MTLITVSIYFLSICRKVFSTLSHFTDFQYFFFDEHYQYHSTDTPIFVPLIYTNRNNRNVNKCVHSMKMCIREDLRSSTLVQAFINATNDYIQISASVTCRYGYILHFSLRNFYELLKNNQRIFLKVYINCNIKLKQSQN